MTGRGLALVVGIGLAFGTATQAHSLIPGGGNAKADCYAELDVRGAENPGSTGNQVQGNKTLLCTDGEACDQGACGDNRCDLSVALCVNQRDPNLASCQPPASLDSVKVKSKGNVLLNVQVPQLLEGSQCGAFVDGGLTVTFKKNGKPKIPKTTINITAKAPKGTKPRTDGDQITLKCLPRTTPCPSTTTTTTATTTTTTTLCQTPCQGFSSLDFTIGPGATTCAGVCTVNPGRTCFTDGGCAAEAGGSLGTCSGTVCSFSYKPCANDAECVDQAAGERCITLTPPDAASSSGQISFSDSTSGRLGIGCLYFGGGNNILTPPAPIPDGSTVPFQTTCCGSTYLGPSGTAPASCSYGVEAASHCLNGNAGTDGQGACTSDANCGGAPNTCGPDARCYFGPPLPIAGGPAPTCLLNVFSEDAHGTIDPSTGQASIDINLFTRIFVQPPTHRCHNGAAGNSATGKCDTDADCGGQAGSCKQALPCPVCVSNKCVGGARHGQACTAAGSVGTTLDCPLALAGADASFLSTLAVHLGPLTTGTSTSSPDADGNFCPAQNGAGAFGQGLVQGSFKVTGISETGQAPGSLTDLAPHAGRLAYTFCIPATGTFLDNVASLPGPGAVALPGTFQLKP